MIFLVYCRVCGLTEARTDASIGPVLLVGRA
jgi:hypothetical protein